MALKFRGLAILTSLLFCLIGLIWLLVPGLPMADWGLTLTPSTALLGRRSAALYLGLAAIFFWARNADPSPARTALARGIALMCLMLAVLGVYDYATGHVTLHILVAVVLEMSIGSAFLYVERKRPLHASTNSK